MATLVSSGSLRPCSTTASLMSPEPMSRPIVVFFRPKSAIGSAGWWKGIAPVLETRARDEGRSSDAFGHAPHHTGRRYLRHDWRDWK